MAFGRVLQLDIGNNNGIGLRVSGLNFTFEVERSVERENNYARINIYNAKKETRDKVLIRGNNISLKCGYRDENNLGLVFFGVIEQSTSRRENSEYITEIYATDFGSNQINIKKQITSFNFSPGITYSTVLQNLSSILNVPISGIENVSSIVLNNGLVFYGTIIQLVKLLQKKLNSYGVGLYFDLGEMVIYNLGTQSSKFGIVRISPKSGLIGEVEEIIDEEDKGKKRIVFRSLLNPKLKPNTIIQVKSTKVNGAFAIQKIIFNGGNTGEEDFIAEVEALI